MKKAEYVAPQAEVVQLRLNLMSGFGLDENMHASGGMTPMAKRAAYSADEQEDDFWLWYDQHKHSLWE